MAEDVKVPKLGKVNKKVLIPIVVAAGGYIGYRYWQARNDVGTGDPVDPGMEDPGTLPAVAGAVRPDNDYGDPNANTGGSSGGGGFRGLTNSEWTEWVADRLQQDGRWTYSEIAIALGNFLNNKPLTTEQQNIAQAALGIAGYPPVGSHTIVPGGNTAITVAPTGVVGTATGPTTISVAFTAVPGAATYNGYIGSAASTSGPGSPLVFSNLTPGRSYTIQVAAVSSSGVVGPKSSTITVKTSSAAMPKPSQPTVTLNSGGGRVTLTTKPVPYATTYKWYLNGKIFNSTPTPAVTLTSLKTKARYSPGVTVQAQGPTGPAGALSLAKSFTTK